MRRQDRYVGIDIHKDYGAACIMDSAGNVVEELEFDNSKDGIGAFVKKLKSPQSRIRAAVESTGYMWVPLYDAFDAAGMDICLVNPHKTRVIAESKFKTDKLSAKWLAKLLRWNLLATCYVPTKVVRDIRDVVRLRMSLVRMRTQLKNKIHAILSKNGVKFEGTDMFGKAGMEFLRSVQLCRTDRITVDAYLSVIENVSKQIEAVEAGIAVEATEDVKLLMSIPGIDYYSASLICSEIGDIKRFETHEKLASWVGLVPSIHQSGEMNYSGHITKQGSRRMRWILVQCAYVSVNTSPKIGEFYRRLAARRGHNKAIVAVARKLVKIVHGVLTTRKRSDYAIDKSYERKLSKLERLRSKALAASEKQDT